MFRRARGLAATLLALWFAGFARRCRPLSRRLAPTDPDFALQGEYSGESTRRPAIRHRDSSRPQGDGKFTAVSLHRRFARRRLGGRRGSRARES